MCNPGSRPEFISDLVPLSSRGLEAHSDPVSSSSRRTTSCAGTATAECSTSSSSSNASPARRPSPRRSPRNTRRRGGEAPAGPRSPSPRRCPRGTWGCLPPASRCPPRPASGVWPYSTILSWELNEQIVLILP